MRKGGASLHGRMIRKRDDAERDDRERDEFEKAYLESDQFGPDDPEGRVPFEEWKGIVDIVILPHVLTPSDATIVVMRPLIDNSANLLWIFPKTTTTTREATYVTARYIADCLEDYTIPTRFGENLNVFRKRRVVGPGKKWHSQIHTSILKLHRNGKMETKDIRWTGVFLIKHVLMFHFADLFCRRHSTASTRSES